MRLFKAWYQVKDKKNKQTKSKKPKNKQTRNWYIELRDHRQILRRIPAFVDKAASEALGRKIERLVSFKVAGEQPDPPLSRWIEQIPDNLRLRLARLGLIDGTRISMAKPLSEHIDDFQKTIGDDTAYAKRRASAVRQICDACKFRTWQDISGSEVRKYLSGLRMSGAIAHSTFNDRIKVIKQFCRWMVRDRRAVESPVGYLKTEKVTVIRHERRPLDPEEVRRLLKTTYAARERFNMTGPERVMLYRLAIETGLRRNELKSLRVSSFDLEANTVTARAYMTKNKNLAKLPLRPDTATQLRVFFVGKKPDAQAFAVPVNTAHMIKADEVDAGIPYVDDEGRYADFHALRHTTASWLAANNVHPKIAQSIMRHSDINLTMSRYTHVFTDQEAEAVARFPDLSLASCEDQDEGGDIDVGQKDSLVDDLPNEAGEQRISMNSSEQTVLPDGSKNGVFAMTGRVQNDEKVSVGVPIVDTA